MPIYQYECDLCRFNFERKQGFDDNPAAICPKCQGQARRVFNSVPIIFKGSGFYITDSRRGADRHGDGTNVKAKEEKPDKGTKKEK